jgi:hypothetical protein
VAVAPPRPIPIPLCRPGDVLPQRRCRARFVAPRQESEYAASAPEGLVAAVGRKVLYDP